MDEIKVIIPDILPEMMKWCSIQPDIDETKLRAANVIAQRLDIKEVIGQVNIDRCIDLTEESPEKDLKLRSLLAPAICFFTYSRLLKLFPGTFTDSGYTIDKEASDKNVTRHTANDYSDTAVVFLKDALDYLALENPTSANAMEKKVFKRIRTIGGRESIGSSSR